MSSGKFDRDLKKFLSTYYGFDVIEYPNKNYIGLVGNLHVIDDKLHNWGGFEIEITINKEEYPYTTPIVTEKSNVIPRINHYDWHISEDGVCCLDIPHRLLRRKRLGIDLINFYKDVIYPFFSNYYYRVDKHEYANGEYKHGFNGVIQFYKEEHGLIDIVRIIALIEAIINNTKYEVNKICPICDSPKFKKCCGKKIAELVIYGNKQLSIDLDLFKKTLEVKKSQLESVVV